MEIKTLYTHIDFDGIGSAAIFTHFNPVESIHFTTPKHIVYEPITETDAILDLPFSRRCAIWFDHHEQNFEDPKAMGYNPDTIPGLRCPALSCARVILTYFQDNKHWFPDYFHDLVVEIDRFDSMRFHSLEDWLMESPGKIINDSLTLPDEDHRTQINYFKKLTELLRDKPIMECSKDVFIQERYVQHVQAVRKSRELFQKIIRFYPSDHEQRIVILDFTGLKFQPFVDKKLAFIDHPRTDYLLTVYPFIQNRVKTNTVSVSLSKNFLKATPESIDWGEYFSQQNIGGGHADAAGARLEASSKAERDRKLDKLIQDILAKLQIKTT